MSSQQRGRRNGGPSDAFAFSDEYFAQVSSARFSDLTKPTFCPFAILMASLNEASILVSSVPIPARNTLQSRWKFGAPPTLSRSCNQRFCLTYCLLTRLEELSTRSPKSALKTTVSSFCRNHRKRFSAGIRTPNFETRSQPFSRVSVSR